MNYFLLRSLIALSTQETPCGEGPEEQHPETEAGTRSSGAEPDTYIRAGVLLLLL